MTQRGAPRSTPAESEVLLQNALYRPEQKIYPLKTLVGTANSTVPTNAFFRLIFQNFILQ